MSVTTLSNCYWPIGGPLSKAIHKSICTAIEQGLLFVSLSPGVRARLGMFCVFEVVGVCCCYGVGCGWEAMTGGQPSSHAVSTEPDVYFVKMKLLPWVWKKRTIN